MSARPSARRTWIAVPLRLVALLFWLAVAHTSVMAAIILTRVMVG